MKKTATKTPPLIKLTATPRPFTIWAEALKASAGGFLHTATAHLADTDVTIVYQVMYFSEIAGRQSIPPGWFTTYYLHRSFGQGDIELSMGRRDHESGKAAAISSAIFQNK